MPFNQVVGKPGNNIQYLRPEIFEHPCSIAGPTSQSDVKASSQLSILQRALPWSVVIGAWADLGTLWIAMGVGCGPKRPTFACFRDRLQRLSPPKTPKRPCDRSRATWRSREKRDLVPSLSGDILFHGLCPRKFASRSRCPSSQIGRPGGAKSLRNPCGLQKLCTSPV